MKIKNVLLSIIFFEILLLGFSIIHMQNLDDWKPECLSCTGFPPIEYNWPFFLGLILIISDFAIPAYFIDNYADRGL